MHLTISVHPRRLGRVVISTRAVSRRNLVGDASLKISRREKQLLEMTDSPSPQNPAESELSFAER